MVVSVKSLVSRDMSTSLPIWLWVSSEKPSSKLEGARRTPTEGDGASWVKREGETGAACAMLLVWRMLCSASASHAQAMVVDR